MATAQMNMRGGLKPLAAQRSVARSRSLRVPVRAVAEPQLANGVSSNGTEPSPSLSGWEPASWRQRTALQVRGSAAAPQGARAAPRRRADA